MVAPRLSQVRPEGSAGQYPKVNSTADGWVYDAGGSGGGTTLTSWIDAAHDYGVVADGTTDDGPALTNAIEDALLPFGARVTEQHLAPATILRLAGVIG